jgi:hypothetical protein
MLKTKPLEERPPQVSSEEEIFLLQDQEKNREGPVHTGHPSRSNHDAAAGHLYLCSCVNVTAGARGVFFNPALEYRTGATAMVQQVDRCGGKGMNDDSPLCLD